MREAGIIVVAAIAGAAAWLLLSRFGVVSSRIVPGSSSFVPGKFTFTTNAAGEKVGSLIMLSQQPIMSKV